MKGLIIAIQFLTRLPTPRIASTGKDFAHSMRWFPGVGLLVGAIIAGGGWAGSLVDPWVGAIIALALWVAITGALHLDGLGDIADAVGAGHGQDRERLLRILADPHIGSFGTVTLVIQLLAKLVLLHALFAADLFIPLIGIPVVARMQPLFWTVFLPQLHDGLGAHFDKAIRKFDLVFWTVLLLATLPFAPAFAVAILFVPFWGWWIMRRFGGISGDGHGAGIELGETILLLVLAIQVALA